MDEPTQAPRDWLGPMPGLCTKRLNPQAWFDGLTTNGATKDPFALSLSKGNYRDRADTYAKPSARDHVYLALNFAWSVRSGPLLLSPPKREPPTQHDRQVADWEALRRWLGCSWEPFGHRARLC